METPKDPFAILEGEEVKRISQLAGVMRVDLEFYRTSKDVTSLSHPIFVVFCNSSFREREKIPGHIEGIRVIVSYEEAVSAEEAQKMQQEAEEEDDEDEEPEEEEDSEDE